MTTQQFFLSAWHWDPFGIAVCALALGYAIYRVKRRHWELGLTSALLLWLAILVLALLSPISTLARSYLFSAHMFQHLLLLMVVPPLFLLTLPQWRPGEKPRPIPIARLGKILTFIPATWLAGVGAMWFWHVPLLCNAATSTPGIYALQGLSLLFLGALFWWPIAGPRADQHLPPLAGIAYLVSACFACTLLGIYITFAPVSVCSVYVHPADRLGILPLIQNQWGLTPETDQHIGGLLMWVPACLIYLSGVVGLLARWYAGSETTLAGTAPVTDYNHPVVPSKPVVVGRAVPSPPQRDEDTSSNKEKS